MMTEGKFEEEREKDKKKKKKLPTPLVIDPSVMNGNDWVR